MQVATRSGDRCHYPTESAAIPKGGPALLFQQPDNYPYPVVTNLFGSQHRMRLALGLDSLEDLTTSFRYNSANNSPVQGVTDLGKLCWQTILIWPAAGR